MYRAMDTNFLSILKKKERNQFYINKTIVKFCSKQTTWN